jgi:hypothetical protein
MQFACSAQAKDGIFFQGKKKPVKHYATRAENLSHRDFIMNALLATFCEFQKKDFRSLQERLPTASK